MTRPPTAELLPRLGLVEATLVVMGGIVGSGIFINPSVVARHVHSPALILGACGGLGYILRRLARAGRLPIPEG